MKNTAHKPFVLENFVDGVVKRAKDMIVEFGHLVPVAFVIHPKDGDVGIDIIGMQFDDDESKVEAVKILASHCKTRNAIGCVLIADVWFTTRKEGQLIERPSLAADRTEAIIVNTYWKGKSSANIYPYVRDGKNIEWLEMNDSDIKTLGGMFPEELRW